MLIDKNVFKLLPSSDVLDTTGYLFLPSVIYGLFPEFDLKDYLGEEMYQVLMQYDNRIYGLGKDDSLDGGTGNDFIDSGWGDDTLIGGAGSDYLFGSFGNDVFIQDSPDGTDTILGGMGWDKVDYSNGGRGVAFNLFTGVISINGVQQQVSGVEHLIGSSGDTDSIDAREAKNDITFTVGQKTRFNKGFDIRVVEGFESFLSGSGNDTLNGNERNNALSGFAGDDTLKGFAGNDTLRGGDGKDSLLGGSGNDLLEGDKGNDRLFGEAGNDTLSGGLGNDFLDGGSGNDELNGNEGRDTLLGGDGADTLKGGSENDILRGGNGHDSLEGDSGDDLLEGDAGNDTLDGGDGDDTLKGGDGNDSMLGGNGTDSMEGGNGNDTMDGGASEDTLKGGAGDDSMKGGAGNDYMEGGSGNDTLLGEEGNDSMIAGDGNDSIEGGEGNDSVQGGEGNDTVKGGEGDDNIVGEDGDDHLEGDEGNDTLIGGDGNDSLVGGEGNDALEGNDGDDTLNGGAGDDSLVGGDGDDLFFQDSVDGADSIYGGLGTDTVDYRNLTNTITYDTINRIVDKGSYNDILNDIERIQASLLLGDIFDASAETADLNINLTTGNAIGLAHGDMELEQFENVNGGTGNDLLTGSSLNNVINGGDGNDTIVGEAGSDNLSGNEGDDIFIQSDTNGNDIIDGGDQNDTIDYRANIAVTFRTHNNTVLKGASVDTFSNIEIILGSDDDGDTVDASQETGNVGINLTTGDITGISSGVNFIQGFENASTGDGNDTLTGSAANNILRGGTGNDTYEGYTAAGFGEDIIFDTLGSDTLNFHDGVTGFNTTDVVSWTALDLFDGSGNPGTDGLLDSLEIDFGGGDKITIHYYFDNSSAAVGTSGYGQGEIETLHFGDFDWTFADVLLVATT